jgi:clathrin heavy chain
MLFTRLMEVCEETIDHSRVVSQLRRTGDWALHLGQKYLKAVQKYDLSPVNEALNEVCKRGWLFCLQHLDPFSNLLVLAVRRG